VLSVTLGIWSTERVEAGAAADVVCCGVVARVDHVVAFKAEDDIVLGEPVIVSFPSAPMQSPPTPQPTIARSGSSSDE
jgi:hypothetical protein